MKFSYRFAIGAIAFVMISYSSLVYACMPPEFYSPAEVMARGLFLVEQPFDNTYTNISQYRLIFREDSVATCPSTRYYIKSTFANTFPFMVPLASLYFKHLHALIPIFGIFIFIAFAGISVRLFRRK